MSPRLGDAKTPRLPCCADVCDPACGLGRFLAAVARHIAERVARIGAVDPEPARNGSSQAALRASRVGRLAVEARGAGRRRRETTSGLPWPNPVRHTKREFSFPLGKRVFLRGAG